MTDSPQRPTESDNDDWLTLLAGRPAPAADSHTRREAEMLRQAVLARPVRPINELSDADLARGRERLQFRLRREAPPPAPVRSGWRRPALWSGLAAGLAAGLAGLALLPLLWSPGSPPPGAESGVEPPPRIKRFRLPTVVRVDQPAAAACGLAISLTGLGIAVQPIQQAERWLIDVQLPDPPSPELTALLARHGVRLPPDRRLLVEFALKPAKSPR